MNKFIDHFGIRHPVYFDEEDINEKSRNYTAFFIMIILNILS